MFDELNLNKEGEINFEEKDSTGKNPLEILKEYSLEDQFVPYFKKEIFLRKLKNGELIWSVREAYRGLKINSLVDWCKEKNRLDKNPTYTERLQHDL